MSNCLILLLTKIHLIESLAISLIIYILIGYWLSYETSTLKNKLILIFLWPFFEFLIKE
jgi:hypothetical protein